MGSPVPPCPSAYQARLDDDIDGEDRGELAGVSTFKIRQQTQGMPLMPCSLAMSERDELFLRNAAAFSSSRSNGRSAFGQLIPTCADSGRYKVTTLSGRQQ